MGVIRELVTRWGFKVDDAKVEKFDNAIASAKTTAAAATAAVGAMAGAMFAAAQTTATTGDEAAKTARALGTTAEALQEVRHAAGLSGMNVEQTNAIMRDLNKNSSNAAKGNKGLRAEFRALGIAVKSFNKLPVDKKLETLADALAKVQDPAERARVRMVLMGKAGFKAASFLDGGSAAIRTMREEARQLGIVIDEDTTQASEAFNDSLDRLRAVGRGIVFTVGKRLIPIITEAADATKKWILENRKAIAANLDVAINNAVSALQTAVKWIKIFASGVASTVEWLGGFNRVLFYAKFLLATFVTYQALQGLIGLVKLVQSAVAVYRALGAAALLAQAKALLLPIAIAALIVILGLLVDDFQAFFDGQNSAIGELVKKWPILGEIIYGLRDAYNAAVEGLSDFFLFWMETWEKIKKAAADVPGSLEALWSEFTTNLKRDVGELGDDISELFLGIVKDAAKKLSGLVAKVELVADELGLDSALLRGVRVSLDEFSAPGGPGAAGVSRQASRAANVPRRAPNQNNTFGGSTFNVYQQPGEDGDAFAKRVAAIQSAQRKRDLRFVAANVATGLAY